MINDMKAKLTVEMIKQLREINSLADALAALDNTPHSGQNDVFDQLKTITNILTDLDGVLHRTLEIIPT